MVTLKLRIISFKHIALWFNVSIGVKAMKLKGIDKEETASLSKEKTIKQSKKDSLSRRSEEWKLKKNNIYAR